MKFIFDFDDVIHNSTTHHKELFLVLEKYGIPRPEIENYYKKNRTLGFSLRSMLDYFVTLGRIDASKKKSLYDEDMGDRKKFLNEELIELIKKLGKYNCYLVTYGNQEYQQEKIDRTEVASLFSGINIVQGSKKEAIERICEKHKDEKVIFIDDKAHHFEGLDFKKYPNLKTILYDEQGLNKLKAEINS